MAQGTDESEEDIVLGEWPSGPDSELDATSGKRECYSIDESDKTWFVFESDSGEEEFYGFDWLCKQLMFLKLNAGHYNSI